MMADKLMVGKYYPLDSPVHNLDARAKLLIMILYMATLFTASGWLAFALFTAVFLVFLFMSQVPIYALWRGMWLIVILIAVGMFFNFFATSGTVIAQWGFLQLTAEGLAQGLKLGLRLILLIFFVSLLTLCTRPLDLTDGLEQLLSPLAQKGAPIHEFAMVISLALRFIPTILQELDRIVLAQKARGAQFSGGLINKIKQTMPLLIPLFISTFRRADDLALAMDARCYTGGQGRSRWRQNRWRAADTVVIIIFLAMMALIIYWRIRGLYA